MGRSNKLGSVLKILSIAGVVLGGAAKLFNTLAKTDDSDSMDILNYDSGCTWHCDYCDAILNEQPGFSTISGTWVCTECGALNDVSDDNILPEGTYEFTPHPLQEPEDEEMRLRYNPDYEGFDPEDL